MLLGFGHDLLKESWALVIALVFCYTFRGFSRALGAHLLHDHTPTTYGTLTLNPAVHVDPIITLYLFIASIGISFVAPTPLIATILLILALVFLAPGWMRHVFYDVRHMKPLRYAPLLMGLAGLVGNLVLCVITLYLLKTVLIFLSLGWIDTKLAIAFTGVLDMMMRMSATFFAFSLLPIPPLDGFEILRFFFPRFAERIEDMTSNITGLPIVLILIFLPPFNLLFTALIKVVIWAASWMVWL